MKTKSLVKSSEWLKSATTTLSNNGIGTARLDALVLLEDCLGVDRSLILAHPEDNLTRQQLNRLNHQINKRSNHLPLAYIRGKTEFYGRSFMINNKVLEPRPETETMIDVFKSLNIKSGSRIADIGSGSGCIGITVKLELPDLIVDLYDIDNKAIKVSKKNSLVMKVDLDIYEADIFIESNGPYFVVMANLPYVPDSYSLNTDALNEPKIAIFGGKDGLDVYRRLFNKIDKSKWKPKYILTESLPPQHQNLTLLASKSNYCKYLEDDFIVCFKLG